MSWNTQTLSTYDTEYSADSVEFCPIPEYENYVVCGTYQLIEGVQTTSTEQLDDDGVISTHGTRIGRMHIFVCGANDEDNSCALSEQYRKDVPALLDMKWYRTTLNGLPCVGVVDAIGELRLYNLDTQRGAGELQKCNSLSCRCSLMLNNNQEQEDAKAECLGLSLDWSFPSSNSPSIACSDSLGKLTVATISDSGPLVSAQWQAHDYEAWITAFNYHDPQLLYSGGDDNKLKCWDLRMDPAHPCFTSKRHVMGVCSIQSNPVTQHLLASGSYDEHVLVWDSRNMKSPLHDTIMGGGVWRIKWHPIHGNMILTATMYNGFHVLDCNSAAKEGSLSIITHYEKHESLAYGADWYYGKCPFGLCASVEEKTDPSPLGAPHHEDVIATCSFYDHSLHLWKLFEGTCPEIKPT